MWLTISRHSDLPWKQSSYEQIALSLTFDVIARPFSVLECCYFCFSTNGTYYYLSSTSDTIRLSLDWTTFTTKQPNTYSERPSAVENIWETKSQLSVWWCINLYACICSCECKIVWINGRRTNTFSKMSPSLPSDYSVFPIPCCSLARCLLALSFAFANIES